jgi:hypothetical protein
MLADRARRKITALVLVFAGCMSTMAWACPGNAPEGKDAFVILNSYYIRENGKPGVDLTVVSDCLGRWLQVKPPGDTYSVPYFRYLANYADLLAESARRLERTSDAGRLRVRELEVRLILVQYTDTFSDDILPTAPGKTGAERKTAESNLNSLITVADKLGNVEPFAKLARAIRALQTINDEVVFNFGRASLSCSSWRLKDGYAPVPASKQATLCSSDCRSYLLDSLDLHSRWTETFKKPSSSSVKDLFAAIKQATLCQ